MLGFKKKGPDREFTHAFDCKLVKIDPGIKIPWSEMETGYWRAECQCGIEYFPEPLVDRRVRLDPLDPANAHHAPQCERRDTTDPAILRALLKVTDRDGYAWVECGICEHGWQVPHYAA